eukprot:scaffold67801_cov55-Phaeocystis_antarctica.AAC.4
MNVSIFERSQTTVFTLRRRREGKRAGRVIGCDSAGAEEQRTSPELAARSLAGSGAVAAARWRRRGTADVGPSVSRVNSSTGTRTSQETSHVCRAALAISDAERAGAGAAAGAGGGADAARGRQQSGLFRRVPPARQARQVLRSAGEAQWQNGLHGLLRHRRGGSAVRRAIAGGAGEGCSGGVADERGGAAAGEGGGADAARGRKQDGLRQRVPHQPRPAQALQGAGVAQWQAGVPGQLRHRRGGGAVRRAVAGGAGGGGEGCSGVIADERGGAAAGAGGGDDVAQGRQQDGLPRRVPQARQAQTLPGAGEPRWQASDPGQLHHRRGGGAVRRA